MSDKTTAILIADDDPQLLRLMVRNLQMEGYDVTVAVDGQQALEHAPPSRRWPSAPRAVRTSGGGKN